MTENSFYPLVAVDDDAGVLLGYEMTLGRSDLPPMKTFSDPVAAREFLLAAPGVRVALLDLIMPSLDGHELLEAVKLHRPDIECIVITAVDEAESAMRAVKLGAYDYLVKPIDPIKLHLTVERALERSWWQTPRWPGFSTRSRQLRRPATPTS